MCLQGLFVPYSFKDIFFQGGLLFFLNFYVFGYLLFFTREAMSRRNFLLKQKLLQSNRDLESKSQKIKALFESLPQIIIHLGKNEDDDIIIESEVSELIKNIHPKPNSLSGENFCKEILSLFGLSKLEEDQIRSVLDQALDAPLIQYEVNSHLLPKKLKIPHPQSKAEGVFDVKWQPIVDANDDIEGFVLILNEITAILELDAKRKISERRNSLVLELISLPPQKSCDFIANASSLMEDLRKTNAIADNKERLIYEYRYIHTLKGITVTLGIDTLSGILHEIERLKI